MDQEPGRCQARAAFRRHRPLQQMAGALRLHRGPAGGLHPVPPVEEHRHEALLEAACVVARDRRGDHRPRGGAAGLPARGAGPDRPLLRHRLRRRSQCGLDLEGAERRLRPCWGIGGARRLCLGAAGRAGQHQPAGRSEPQQPGHGPALPERGLQQQHGHPALPGRHRAHGRPLRALPGEAGRRGEPLLRGGLLRREAAPVPAGRHRAGARHPLHGER